LAFREKEDGKKDGTWGGPGDLVPGWDHVGMSFNDRVYESHPGYATGNYWDKRAEEFVEVNAANGVQQEHTLGSFEHDSTDPNNSPVIRFQELEIPTDLGQRMVEVIEPLIGSARFQLIANVSGLNLEAIEATLSPAAQKGRDENGTFTCVGLIEWAAERAGHNGGQGFIPNRLESITIGNNVIPFLSPELLAGSLGDRNRFTRIVDGVVSTKESVDTAIDTVTEIVETAVEIVDTAVEIADTVVEAVEWVNDFVNKLGKPWLQGWFDPVDFVITDPLGRRLGHTAELGTINEIPGALYTGDGSLEQFLILDPLPGNYAVELVGLGDDATAAIGGSSTDGELVSEFLAEGETRTFSIAVPPEGTGSGIADLSITRTDSSEQANLGENITYDLIVTNESSDSATGVTLADNLPPGVNLVSATSSKGSVSEADGVITAELGDLSSGETAAVTITVNPIAAGVITSTASVTAEEADPNITNNLIVHGRTVNPAEIAPADLELTKTIDNPSPGTGDLVNFTLTLTNNGPGVASGIQVTDLLPPELTFVSAASNQGSYDPSTGVWDAGNLRDGLSTPLTITAAVNSGGSITTTAEITATGQADPDSTPGNNNPDEDDQATVSLNGSGGSREFKNIFGIGDPPIVI
jgi:uncharacterized repeat protein (TIGR01451 family)